ncbi:MAG: redoxin domain-containing protein [Planctomycetes bacterium]|nr:redoxin domain-containing protein [Planctomycetota bacterium]MCB9888879.1 redoxin domain-containing protein [Planctomycetota bacterium]
MRIQHLAVVPLVFLSATLLPPAGQERAGKTTEVPAVGKPAPSFRVNDHTGKAVSVGGKAKHWTVLAFYPKADTPG